MKRFRWLSVALIILIFTSGCSKKENEPEKEKVPTNYQQPVLKEKLNFEINDNAVLADLLAEDNKIELINGNDVIDTKVLGEKELVIKYKENDVEKEQLIKIKVVDTKAPAIEFKKELSTKVGTKIDLLKNVKAIDNSLEDIKVRVEGNYDFSKTGTYNLKYVATDSSNNKVEEEFVLNVTKKATTNNTSNSSNNNATSNNNTSTNTNNNSSSINNNQIQNNTDKKEEGDRTASKLITSATHKYQVNYTYGYVKKTDNFNAKSRQDILNILYTALNEGADKFGFYCDYSECENDLKKLLNNGVLSYVQDYIHPYNTFKGMRYTLSNDFVLVEVTKTYSNSDIAKLENKVNSIMSSKVTSSLSLTEKIKVLHDYLVENTSYQDNGSTAQQTALGPLFNGKSVCEGYAHAMAIFLNRLKVPNYRVSVPGVHMWNLVYAGGKWKHLDVTWDDPITTDPSGNRKEILRHDFFLISSSEVKNQDVGDNHAFDKNIFKEA